MSLASSISNDSVRRVESDPRGLETECDQRGETAVDAYPDGKKRDSSEENSKRVPPFTIFVKSDKAFLIILISAIGFWSSISSPIYFPAIPTLSKYFHVSDEIMNISVVLYLIFQGLAPSVSSNFADTFGKRPVFIASFLIYIASCIAISQTNVYWLLAFLRCIQASGIAPVIAIGSGVAGDVCTAADRGGFVGIVNGMLLVGNGIGGLVGALIIHGFDWRAIFIFLAIGGGATLLFVLIFLPETSRMIVGNGSIVPKSAFNKAPVLLFPHIKPKLTNDTSTLAPKEKMDFFAPFKLVLKIPVICTLLPAGLQFAAWTMTLTSISTVLESDAYNYSVIHVGLIYLPQGIACFVASLLSGKALNVYYRYRSNLHEKKYQDWDIEKRPPLNKYRIRLDLAIVPATFMILGLIIFGWCLEYKRHIISIIISTILISFAASSFMSIVITMLVDLQPTKGSTAASSVNLVRCLLAAIGVAVLEKMSHSMTLGGTYTFLAGICFLADLLLVGVVIHSTKKLYEGYDR